jgi:chromosome segregation ATPase
MAYRRGRPYANQRGGGYRAYNQDDQRILNALVKERKQEETEERELQTFNKFEKFLDLRKTLTAEEATRTIAKEAEVSRAKDSTLGKWVSERDSDLSQRTKSLETSVSAVTDQIAKLSGLVSSLTDQQQRASQDQRQMLSSVTTLSEQQQQAASAMNEMAQRQLQTQGEIGDLKNTLAALTERLPK